MSRVLAVLPRMRRPPRQVISIVAARAHRLALRPVSRMPLSMLLVTINVALLLIAVGGVAFGALRLLGQLADEQALTRVAAANATAQQEIIHTADDLLIQAQVLAQRPTLNTLLANQDIPDLGTYLGQYQQGSHLVACAVWERAPGEAQGHIVVARGASVAWAVLAARATSIGSSVLFHDPGGGIALGAWATTTAMPGSLILVAQPLDPAFAARIGGQLGLPVTILARDGITQARSPAMTALFARVLSSNAPASAHLTQPDAYVAVAPLRDASGTVDGVIATVLPAAATVAALQELAHTLLILTLVVGLLSAAISLGVGRQLSRPLRRLAYAAQRMGTGDLASPVPAARSQEIGMLATTLEEMRSRLLRTTSDLHRQRAEAQAILGGIVEGVFTVDRERRIRYLNPQAAAMLGVAPEDAIGRFCGDVLMPTRVNGVRPCDGQCPIVHARFQGVARASERLCLANGGRRTVVITSAAPEEEQQIQVLRDESEVEATRRIRDAVLANISHEFRTPLAAQLASIELLLDQLPDLSTEQIGDLVLVLRRGSLRLTHLIDNLLESVRIESGRDTIRRQPVALDEIIEESVELTRPLIEYRHQAIDYALPYPLPSPLGDAPRLTQVFVNLLANASKFAPAQTTITLGGAVESGEVMLWVDDEGPGIPPGAEHLLFDRWVRASDDEPEQSGMGLGLWIAKSIVERHGGRIGVQRRSAGGTRVTVTLPRGEQDEGSGRG